jgi:hypothetical protein
MFVCRLNIGNRGYAKFTKTPELPPRQYMIGDTVKLTGKITKISPQSQPNSPMYLVAKVFDEDGKIIGGRSEGWMLTVDKEYDIEKDAEFSPGVPGFTITSANFYSRGVQSTYPSTNQAIIARVNGRLNNEVHLSFKKVDANTYYWVEMGTPTPNVCRTYTQSEECKYISGKILVFDGTSVTLSGEIGTQQSSDNIIIPPSVGGEANWKVEVSLHYADANDPTKYEAEPIDIDGEQKFTLSFKVIGQTSSTGSQCDAKYSTLPITAPCVCGGQICPKTVGAGTTGTYKYCYGACRLHPQCAEGKTTPITDSCVCDPSRAAGGEADCGKSPTLGKNKYCVNKQCIEE